MKFPERYERNRASISPAEQEKLAQASVLVLGCGGLGGYVIENLVRIGVGHITVVDGDVFQPSNLNRQLLSSEKNLGCSKAAEAKCRAEAINSEVSVEAVEAFADEGNIDALVMGKDLIIDALDNSKTRIIAAKAAANCGIAMVHGAISGWTGRVYTVAPEDEMIDFLCSGETVNTAGNLPFTASLCASIEAAEAVKILLGRAPVTLSRLLEIDLATMSFELVEL